MKRLLLVCAVLALVLAPSAHADVVTIFSECVGECGVPPEWTVERRGAERSDTWGDPYPCGGGMSTCLPEDPSEGHCFICASGGPDPVGPDDEWLISPSIDASTLTTLELSFLHMVAYWSYCDYPKSVMISADGGPFTEVWSLLCTDPLLEMVSHPVTIDLGTYAGCGDLRVCFRFRGTVWALCDSWFIDDVSLSGEVDLSDLFIEITLPEDGTTYSPCAPDTVKWSSNIPAWPGSPDVLDLYWRECGGPWEWFADDNNDGAHPWESAPCDPGCYEVKIVYELDPTVSDTVGFEIVGAPLYIDVTEPLDGHVYSPCAPDTVFWDSNIPASQGSPSDIDLLWRECGGSWVYFASDNNDGAHPWPSAPCDPGCYEVKVVYSPDPVVNDVVQFEVVDPSDTLYVNLIAPANGANYSPCAPGVVTWNSNVDPSGGDVFALYWRVCGDDWYLIGYSGNDGSEPWPSAPCDPGCYEIKIVYQPDPDVRDSATFTIAEDTLYVNLIAPANGANYDPCAPGVVTWESNVGPSGGDVFALYWRVCSDDWYLIGHSSNDGSEPWPSAPCDPGCYELKIVYQPDPDVRDSATFTVSGGGPDPSSIDFAFFVDFSGDADDCLDIQPRVDPVLYTSYTAYLGITQRGADPGGVTGISFAVYVEPGPSIPPGFTNLLPGDLAIGEWETGITLASVECMEIGYCDVVYVASIDLFCISSDPGDILIFDHPEYPRWVVNCEDPSGVHGYCVLTHGGVRKDPEDGDVGCQPNTAVLETSWGAIKALYR